MKAMKALRHPRAAVAPSGSQSERSEQERTDGATGCAPTALPDSEVLEKSVRRTYTAEYKRRILAERGAVKERRDQLRHPAYRKAELLAVAPNLRRLWYLPDPRHILAIRD